MWAPPGAAFDPKRLWWLVSKSSPGRKKKRNHFHCRDSSPKQFAFQETQWLINCLTPGSLLCSRVSRSLVFSLWLPSYKQIETIRSDTIRYYAIPQPNSLLFIFPTESIRLSNRIRIGQLGNAFGNGLEASFTISWTDRCTGGSTESSWRP